MKNTFLLLFTLLSLPVSAQKVDLDAEPVVVRYISLPQQPFPADYQTYSAVLSANPNDLKSIGMADYFFTNNLKVEGYKKIKEGGNFNLELNMSDYRPAGGEMKTNATQGKDKSGKIVTTKTYYYIANYEHSLTLRVKTQDNNTIDEKTWLKGERTFKSREFSSTAEVNDYLRVSLGRDIALDDQQAMSAAMREIHQYLNTQYGYYPTTEKPLLQILDSDKHPDYAGFQEAYKISRSAFATMKPDQPLDSVRLLLQPALTYFEQQKDKYNSDDKGQRKLKYACLYNLTVLYYWTENLDKASEYANAVIANDYDPKDGKRWLDAIAKLKSSFEINGKTTRHIKFEFSQDAETQAAEVKYDSDSEERKEDAKHQSLGLTPNTVQYDGWMTGTDGKENKAIFLLENPRVVGNLFGSGGNVRYAIDKGETYDVGRIDKGKIAAFGFDGRTFKVLQFKSANALSLGSSRVIMEVLYESSKYNAYLAFSGDNDGLNNPPEYALQKVSDQEFISLNGMKFAMNLNKGIKKAFDFCSAAVEVADTEGFKRTNQDVVRLAKMLEGCTP